MTTLQLHIKWTQLDPWTLLGSHKKQRRGACWPWACCPLLSWISAGAGLNSSYPANAAWRHEKQGRVEEVRRDNSRCPLIAAPQIAIRFRLMSKCIHNTDESLQGAVTETENKHQRTLLWPTEERELPKIPVSPFGIFENVGESEPLTWKGRGGGGGGGGGGGDCVMNWRDGASVNNAQPNTLWLVWRVQWSHRDLIHVLLDHQYLRGGNVSVLAEHVGGRRQLRDGAQRRVVIGRLVGRQSIAAVFVQGGALPAASLRRICHKGERISLQVWFMVEGKTAVTHIHGLLLCSWADC